MRSNYFSTDNALKLKEIEIKQKNTPVCPNIETFHQISPQFYNSEIHEILTCLLENFASKDPKRKNNNELIKSIQDFFSEDIIKHLTLRTTTDESGAISKTKQIDQLINEAYVGIKYLNDLRAVTPSFKYIYIILTYKGIPYIIEESLSDAKSLQDALSILPANELGVKSVKSIILQLLIAVHYASKIDVSNFPMDIVVRQTENALIPLYMDHTILYVNTYGWVPVFQRYYTAGSKFENGINNPRSLFQDQNEILQYILSTLENYNPALYELTKFNGHLSIDSFSEIVQPHSSGSNILTCSASSQISPRVKVKEISHQFKTSYSRIDIVVKSGINRINALRDILNKGVSVDQSFIITSVIVCYAECLQYIYQIVDEATRKRSYGNNIDIIDSSVNMLTTTHENSKYIKFFLNGAIERGKILQSKQRSIPLPDFSSKQNLAEAIHNFRMLIANVFYFETTNEIIKNYRTYIDVYPYDFDEAINEACFIKEKLEFIFHENPQVIERFIKIINNDNDAILVELYDGFIEDINDSLESELQMYKLEKSPDDLAKLETEIYIRKVVALDPVPLLGV
jgi:hypothetical protein